MRLLRLAPLLGLACLLLIVPNNASDARAGWGAGGCGPVGPMVSAPVVNAAPFWVAYPPVPGQIDLISAGVHVGSYRSDFGYYRPVRNGVWGDPQEPPVPLPDGFAAAQAAKALRCNCHRTCSCAADKCACKEGDRCSTSCDCKGKTEAVQATEALQMPVEDMGVDWSKIGRQERYTINGREVAQADAERAIVGAPEDKLPDDSAKLSLTIIGSEAERKQALQDLAAPAMASFREHVLVQDYAPDSPMLKCGFVTNGHPTIYLQQPDGKVLARVGSYAGAQTWEAVRKADPGYQKDKDPDPTKPPEKPAATPAGGDAPAPEHLFAGGLVGLAALVVCATAMRR